MEVDVIERSSAPVGARTFVILNPKVVDQNTGVRGSYLKLTRKVTHAISAIPSMPAMRIRWPEK